MITEPSPVFENYYKSSGIERIACLLSELPSDKYLNYFDFISSSHSLEHLERPLESIQIMMKMLHTGGLLFLEVPASNKNWLEFARTDSPHIHFFTHASLQQAVIESGFILLKSIVTGFSYQ